jgi:dTDP-4-amino-4,6-dideoxygalactose transaminase
MKSLDARWNGSREFQNSVSRSGGLIPIAKPYFDEAETNALQGVLESGWLVQGPWVKRFEAEFKDYLGVTHAVATTSCTTALHLALLAAGIGPGDEVLLPSFTFVATANAVEYTGARPVFIDIDLATYTIDPAKIVAYLDSRAQRSDPRPKCILPVSLFGLCADMEAINKIAAQYSLQVIEDAACGFGAQWQGSFAGTECLAGCFSFHPRKMITTGEGVMVITDNDRLGNKIRQLRNHGASKTDLERHSREDGALLPEFNTLGFNSRMTDLQAALGVAQLEKADLILRERSQAASRYERLLGCIPELRSPGTPEGYSHAFQSYVCLYKADIKELGDGTNVNRAQIERWTGERNRLMVLMEKEGISLRQGTHAIHTLGYYKGKYNLNDYDLPMSYLVDRLSVALPLYCGITEAEQITVVNSLKEILRA